VTVSTAPRPRRALGPVAGTVVAVVAWLAVAHSSGAGWVQALGALLTGILVVGLVGPAVALRRARCRVVACPADAVAGRPVDCTVEVTSPLVVRPVHPSGPDVPTGRHRECHLKMVPRHRGVLDRCVVQLASAAPFGLLWWTKRVVVPLPRPLHVAPPVGGQELARPSGPEEQGAGARLVAARVGEPRGARPYRPGDLRGWVHWPATAHTGDLMVREMEEQASPPVTVRAELPGDPDAADLEASAVLGAVARLLGAGRRVVLVTAEAGGATTAPVGDVGAAGRRLARALPQRPPPGVRR
jgi:uncharacterized protein (DUF58 family)